MDRKLHMPEILDLIFTHLEPRNPLFSTVSKTLAALARTCTTFQDPALNALWAHQTSLVPALRCFPEDLWHRSENSRKLTFVNFRRPLVPADWERALFYWKRIKSLRIESLDGDRISPDVIDMLRIHCPAEHLFPNLRKVGWLDENHANSFLLETFLLPRLDSISLAPGQETIMQLSLVRTLGIKCPDLTELDFRGSYRGPQHSPLFHEALLELLPSLKRLELLYICNIDAAIFNHIGGLPYFKCLVVTESPEFIIDGQSASRFPALESLNLWSTTPEVGSAIVRTIEHRGLREIGLAFESAFPDVQTTTRLYNSIDATGSHSTLKTLHIEDEAEYNELHIPDEDQFDSYIVGGKALSILFSFTNLTTIILKPVNGFDLDDTVIERMARSWSRVEVLRLASSIDWDADNGFRTTRPTLVGIHAIAAHCRSLHRLELYFDATTIPVIEGPVTQNKLVEFDVHCSPIHSPRAVEHFLSKIFPRLRTVYSSDESEYGWRKVHDLIRNRVGDVYWAD